MIMTLMRITKGNPEIRVDRCPSKDDGMGNGYHAARRVLASLAPTTPTGLTPPGYQIIDTLGVGGGGATFLALREGSDRPVALKVLHAHAAPGPTRQRAWRELDLLQETHLPCLPRLLDYGVVGDRLFIATEFVSGQRLDENARSIPPSRERWIQLAIVLARVAEAVHSLNERGIIHRDLKPSNILIAGDASPFIIDLGVAALAARNAEETLTADGTPIGTPAFMSPEQARGERDLVSIRSDVYALGATACAVMTGKPPHDLEGVSLHEAVRRVGSEPGREARVLEPELPRPLSAIIAKACAPHPRGRYATAAELAEDLRRFSRREPVLATRPSAWQRAMRWVVRHPIAATGVLCTGMVLGTVASLAASAWWFASRPAFITLDLDGEKFALLKSTTGSPLHQWVAAKGGQLFFAELTGTRGWLGLGRRAVIAGAFAEPDGIAHRLIVSDAEDPRRVLWSTPISPPGITLPPGTEGWVEDSPPERFRCRDALIADIMPDEPGEEIAVVLNHESKSPSCIRVYSLDGRVLWEAWHNGRLVGIEWLSERRLLACGGVVDRPTLAELGLPNGEKMYPSVVFGLSIPPGAVHTDLPIVLESWHESPNSVIPWCRTLPPCICGLTGDIALWASGRDTLRVAINGSGGERKGAVGSFELSGGGVVQSSGAGDWLKVVAPELVDRFRPVAPSEIR